MMETDFIEFATTNLAKPLEDYDEEDHVIDEVLFYIDSSYLNFVCFLFCFHFTCLCYLRANCFSLLFRNV